MDIISTLLQGATLINIVFASFILLSYFQFKKTYLFAFLIFILTLVAWSLTIFYYRESVDVDTTIYWARFLYAAASLIPLTFAIFTKFFLKLKSAYFNFFVIISLIWSGIFLYDSLYGQMIQDVIASVGMEKIISFGGLYTVFNFFVPTVFTVCFLQYQIKIFSKTTKLIEKKQNYIILYGTLTVSSIGMMTNLLLPSMNYFELNWVGQVSTVFWIFIILYAIIKFQLFEIRSLFSRLLYYILGSIIVLAVYYSALEIQTRVYGDPQRLETLILGIPIGLFFIYIYDQYRYFVQEKINIAIINPGWDPREVGINFNEQASTILEYQQVILHLKNTLSATVKPSKTIVYTELDNGDKYLDPIEQSAAYTPNIANLITWWRQAGYYPIQIEEIELDYPQILLSKKEEIYQVVKDMKEHDIQILFPIFNGERISGILMLGRKEGRGIYNSVQRRFIQGLCATTALALARANLYEEVKDFNESLQQRIKEATEEIEQKNRQLSESLRVERDMLDILGHELRTPITTVRNILGTIKLFWDQKSLDDEKMNKYMVMAEENIKREVALLETILASAKIDNDKLELMKEKVDATDVVEDCVFSYTPLANEKKLDIHYKIPEGQVWCIADRVRTQQVLDNLVSNAIKYTREGSITIELTEDEEWVTFNIIDTGEGIKEENLKHLGEKFFRINNYVESDGKLGERQIIRPGGTGIGLYVVFQLIEFMKGQIHVESEFGKGSKFSFKLPKFTEEKFLQMQSLAVRERQLQAKEAEMRMSKESQTPTTTGAVIGNQ